jgi:dimethylhistidine N-methyltransferase
MTPRPITIARQHAVSAGRDRFREDVLHGLSGRRKSIPCKYLYDDRGSALFDEICELEEYYLTRTELDILGRHASEMAAAIGEDVELIEFGTGSGQKTRLLLAALRAPRAYLPIDISAGQLARSASDLASDFSGLHISPVCADFAGTVLLPSTGDPKARRVVYFPGSTIGNFRPRAAIDLLHSVARLVGPGGGLLVGYDLDKDESIVWPAYNDRRGTSARFNLNLLARINRELGADFDLRNYTHRADYVRSKERVELYLESTEDQLVRLDRRVFAFSSGERIHTEDSYKYSPAHFRRLLSAARFRHAQSWTDPREYFCVEYAVVD